MRSTISGRRGTAWLLAGLLVLFTPAVALAQSGGAFIVLYEVLESPPPRPSTGGNVGAFVPNPLAGTLTRLAQATLSGTGVQAEGSISDWVGAAIEAHAQSRVDLRTGQGPLSGVFNVDLAGGAVSGELNGTLDLSMLLALKPIPLAPVTEGQWNTLGKTKLAGVFEGVAQVPVPCSALGSPANNFCYLTPDGSGVEELQAHEFNRDGIPLVRFKLQLVAL